MIIRWPCVLLLLALCALPQPLPAADEPEPDYAALSSAELERVFFDKLMDGDRVAYTDMNDLVWEPVYKELVNRRFGCLRSNATRNADRGWTLADDIAAMLGGPPADFRIVDGRFVVGSACRAHSCPEKGLLIADLLERRVTFGLLHYVRWAPASPKYWDAPFNDEGFLSVFVDPDMAAAQVREVSRVVEVWATDFLVSTPVQAYGVRCDPNR